MSVILFTYLFLIPPENVDISELNIPEVFHITDRVFWYAESPSDPNKVLYRRTSNALKTVFLNELGSKLPGNQYGWDYPEDGSVENGDTKIWFLNEDEDGFHKCGVFIEHKGEEYFHWVKASITLSEKHKDRMDREVRWAILSLFSMDELERYEWIPESPIYTLDKDPPFMIRISK